MAVLFGIFLFFGAKKYFAGLPKVKQDNGRINFVFLGISGGEYKPPDLSDTIIFSSYNTKTGRTFLLSIPRDIWLDFLKAKINTAYHYGGFSLVKQAIGEITGQPIHYVFVLDFEGFKKAVDLLGGVNIKVERTFDDFKYPIAGKENDECDGDPEFKCRYEHLHFEAGLEKMNGERALKYVRSRNAEGEEGTDEARAVRQQKFLTAFKDQALSLKTIFSPKKILGLVIIFSTSTMTDLKKDEYFNLGLNFLRFDPKGIKMETLNGFSGGLLYHPAIHYSRQWVLVPKEGNWDKVQEFSTRNLP